MPTGHRTGSSRVHFFSSASSKILQRYIGNFPGAIPHSSRLNIRGVSVSLEATISSRSRFAITMMAQPFALTRCQRQGCPVLFGHHELHVEYDIQPSWFQVQPLHQSSPPGPIKSLRDLIDALGAPFIRWVQSPCRMHKSTNADSSCSEHGVRVPAPCLCSLVVPYYDDGSWQLNFSLVSCRREAGNDLL